MILFTVSEVWVTPFYSASSSYFVLRRRSREKSEFHLWHLFFWFMIFSLKNTMRLIIRFGVHSCFWTLRLENWAIQFLLKVLNPSSIFISWILLWNLLVSHWCCTQNGKIQNSAPLNMQDLSKTVFGVLFPWLHLKKHPNSDHRILLSLYSFLFLQWYHFFAFNINKDEKAWEHIVWTKFG